MHQCITHFFMRLVCRNNCSGHGYCDRHTKMCVCESFWMQDFFKVHFGTKESNCGKLPCIIFLSQKNSGNGSNSQNIICYCTSMFLMSLSLDKIAFWLSILRVGWGGGGGRLSRKEVFVNQTTLKGDAH